MGELAPPTYPQREVTMVNKMLRLHRASMLRHHAGLVQSVQDPGFTPDRDTHVPSIEG